MKPMIPTALTALAILSASAAQSQATAGVRDNAKMFSAEAVKKAEQAIQEVETDGHLQVLIETIESLNGRKPKDAAVEAAERANVVPGLVVLIAKKEHKVQVEPSKSAEKVFAKPEEERIVATLSEAFRKSEFDRGLLDAVAEVHRAGLRFGVRDNAKMFSAGAVAKANEELDAVRRKTHWNAVIETVDSLGGKPPAQAAAGNASALQVHGLYVLIAKNDHKVYAEPSSSAAKVFPREKSREIDDVVVNAFKAKDFDKGLLDAVGVIRRDAEAASALVVQKAEAPKKTTGETGLQSSLERRDPTTILSPAPATKPISTPTPAAPPKNEGGGSMLPMLLVVGGGILVGLWLLSKLFRRAPQPTGPSNLAGGGYAPGFGPGGGQPTSPPQQGRPGPAQAPAGPGYGYGQAPAPGYNPGYGAPAPPQRGGGGFVSGMLGGAAGAVAGNLLYDQFGRPHEGQGTSHPQGGVVPPHGGQWTGADAGAGAFPTPPSPPAETYDPNAGAGADWGTPEPPAESAPDTGVGGDWGAAPEPQAPAEAETGGDWGAAPDDPGAGGDWGSSEADAGGGGGDGGDWGSGSNDSGGSDDQGGSW